MFALFQLLVIVLIRGIVCPPSPLPTFDSFGPNQLFVNEGQEVVTLSGAHFLKGISKDDCADSCLFVGLVCPTGGRQTCCDSFSYNPNRKTCYLKKRGQNSSLDVKQSEAGWQSFKYWDDETFVPGGGYDGGLPELAQAFRLPAFPYQWAYMSRGPNKLAKTEGDSILTSKGKKFLTNVAPKDCSDECDITPECDAFSYNPNQNKGTCYLKKNSVVDRFVTVDNSAGWTYYWKDSSEKFLECYCGCEFNFACILCGGGYSETCEAL